MPLIVLFTLRNFCLQVCQTITCSRFNRAIVKLAVVTFVKLKYAVPVRSKIEESFAHQPGVCRASKLCMASL